MKKQKKVHPADVIDTAAILGATAFTATILHKGAHDRVQAPTLHEARAAGLRLEQLAGNGKRAVIYATVNGRLHLVPASFQAPVAKAAAAKAKADPVRKSAPKAKAPKAKAVPKFVQAAKAMAELEAKAAKVVGNGGRKANGATSSEAKAPEAAKAPKAAKAGSKTEKALAMILKGQSTRGDIAVACEWPSINLKAIADRRGLKLKTDAAGLITSTKA
jgi:pyruvate/2-oxoglutarate dehydrogenase complex dihydrolipoamide acyltransferase (E2) component